MTLEAFLAYFDKTTRTQKGFMVKCPAHQDGKASLSVGVGEKGDRIVLTCFAGCSAELVVGALGLKLKDLFFYEQQSPAYKPTLPKPQPKVARIEEKKENTPAVLVKIYSYTDALGKEVYQALRYEPKTFRQRHWDKEWIWSMEGVERVLYRLPDVLKAKTVWICEGEKDVDNLVELGYCATCNVGGAGKWLDGYTDALTGKDLVICGDNDEPGLKHVELVFESVSKKAHSVKVVRVPAPNKDASDFIAFCGSAEKAKAELDALAHDAVPHIKGQKLPLFSMLEAEARYRRFAKSISQSALNLGKWLPSFSRLRPLVPGELVLILGSTGTGKTALLQSIAGAALPIPTIMFEMELPEELMFERFLAMKTRMACSDIETAYRDTNDTMGEQLDKIFQNLLICTESGLTLEKLEGYIIRSELKFGQKPKVVLLDYVQLMAGTGKRYERVSDAAEGLKVIAKNCGVVIIFTSQVGRPDDDSPELSVYSGKDSGSLENSAGLIIGAWRDKEDGNCIVLKVLKSTKGGSGLEVRCNFEGATMQIRERAKIHTEDIPN